jgi:hypothetical protein
MAVTPAGCSPPRRCATSATLATFTPRIRDRYPILPCGALSDSVTMDRCCFLQERRREVGWEIRVWHPQG